MPAPLAASALSWLWTVTWQSAALFAIAALLLRVAGRRIPPGVHYATWAIVILRLLTPPLPELAIGLSPAPESSPPNAADAALPTTSAQVPEAPLARPAPGRASSRSPKTARKAPPRIVHADSPPSRDRRASGGFPWHGLATLSWLAVAGVLALRAIARDLRFRRALRRASDGSPRLLRCAHVCARRLRMRRAPRVRVTALVRGPAAYGIFRPVILFPPALDEALDDGELAHVMLHELAHARRGDVLVNQLLLLVRALHWCNPTAHLALSRFDAAREAVRDGEVLASPDAPAPGDYGRTLIRLLSCQRRGGPVPAVGAVRTSSDIAWRITMISRFTDRRPFGILLGACLVTALGGAALVGASAEPTSPEPPIASPQESGLQTIKVVRETPPAPWRKAMERTLQKVVDVDFGSEDQTLADVIAFVRKACDLNVVVRTDVDVAEEPARFAAKGVTLATVLDGVLRRHGCGYAFVDGALFIGPHHETLSAERRFYNVTPLIGEGEEREVRVSHLQDVIRAATPDMWNHEHESIQHWNGLFCISQTPAHHERIHTLLDRLLNGGQGPNTPVPAWRTEIRQALQKKISVAFEETPAGDAVSQLRKLTGLPFAIDADFDHMEPLRFSLKDVATHRVLDWFARSADVSWEVADGTVRIGEHHGQRLGYYRLGNLVDSVEDEDEARALKNHLVDMIRSSVNPPSWELDGANVAFWGHLMITNQTEATHAGIARFLSALRQARR